MARRNVYVVRVVYAIEQKATTFRGLLFVMIASGCVTNVTQAKSEFLETTTFDINPPHNCPDSYEWAVITAAALVSHGYQASAELHKDKPLESKKNKK